MMTRSASKGWLKTSVISLLLLSNNAVARECVPGLFDFTSTVGNFDNLARSFSTVKTQTGFSPLSKQLSPKQIDRLAVEASDVVYSLFKNVGDLRIVTYRRSGSDMILPIEPQSSSQEYVGAPVGYRVKASWNDNFRDGFKQGVFAALYEPQGAGPVIFAFKGTATNNDWIEDLTNQGSVQLRSVFKMATPSHSLGSNAYLELLKRLENGQDVLITGHSLGGGLAQATAYLLQRDLGDFQRSEIAQGKKMSKLGNLHLVTFNALGGQQTLRRFAFSSLKENDRELYKGTRLESKGVDFQIQKTVVESLHARNYANVGDPVSPLFDHIGPKIFVGTPEKPLDSAQTELHLPGFTGFAISLQVKAQLNLSQAVDYHSISLIRRIIDPDFKP